MEVGIRHRGKERAASELRGKPRAEKKILIVYDPWGHRNQENKIVRDQMQLMEPNEVIATPGSQKKRVARRNCPPKCTHLKQQ